METILTCVYCGQEYPAGTPASGSDVDALTGHIKTCEKHPMRKLEEINGKLRSALVGLVGADNKAELEAMEWTLRAAHVPESDKVGMINAIRAIIETE